MPRKLCLWVYQTPLGQSPKSYQLSHLGSLILVLLNDLEVAPANVSPGNDLLLKYSANIMDKAMSFLTGMSKTSREQIPITWISSGHTLV
mmetsp:Transcript_30939/g.65478  ORF Transcript_30939/g.65478 Transcript_30939/m.65478 type:complete len:90 (-) Transcript_30939:326-595(-)